MSIRNKQIIVGVIIFLVLNAIFVTTAYFLKYQKDLSNRKNVENEKKADNVKVDTNIKPPILLNQNPITAIINEEYTFFPHLSDEDSDNSELSLSIVSSPDWITYENGEISGTPLEGDEGNAKVVLRLSDGKNYSDVVIYILVKKA